MQHSMCLKLEQWVELLICVLQRVASESTAIGSSDQMSPNLQTILLELHVILVNTVILLCTCMLVDFCGMNELSWPGHWLN